MAIQRLEKDGYGQIELNQVAWRRDGRIEAQCRLSTEEFSDSKGNDKAENAMLLAVDNVTRTLYKATTAHVAAGLPIGINYSTEKIYDERNPGLKNFALGTDEFLPRVGYPDGASDKFTTNNIAYDTATYPEIEDFEAALDDLVATPLYAGINDAAPGILTIGNGIPAIGPAFRVTQKTTMPDGQLAVQLQSIRA